MFGDGRDTESEPIGFQQPFWSADAIVKFDPGAAPDSDRRTAGLLARSCKQKGRLDFRGALFLFLVCATVTRADAPCRKSPSIAESTRACISVSSIGTGAPAIPELPAN